MNHRFDLHTHSNQSDGTYAPAEIVHFAARGHLDLLAVTDHDCISGVPEAMAAGKEEGVAVIPGVEFDNEWHHELHILGLDVDMDHPVLNRAMEVARERRDKRNEIILSKLDAAGIEVRPFMRTEQMATTKLHIAHAIIAAGYAAEVREAFMKYLRPGTPGYYTEKRFTPEQVLEIIHRSDGVPVLAHPCHIRENLHGLVRELVSMGLLGIEAYYPANTPRQTELYVSLAHQYKLLTTCGSDFHGKNRPGVPVGCAWRESRELEQTYETLMRRMES